MKKVTMFYLATCPYCRKAEQAILELTEEHPEYKEIEIEMIEEEMYPERTKGYDYWYVPTFFIGKEKLYEAQHGQSFEEVRENVRHVLQEAVTG